MKPRLQSGDYPGAVEHGVEAILNTIGGESYKGSGHSVAEANANAAPASQRAIIVFFLGAFVLIMTMKALRFRGRRRLTRAGAQRSGSA
jgi:uncharacterized membrane protein YgcG